MKFMTGFFCRSQVIVLQLLKQPSANLKLTVGLNTFIIEALG